MKKALSATLPTAWLMLPAMFALHSCNDPDIAGFENHVISSNATLPDYTEYGYNTAGANFIISFEKSGTLSHLWLLDYSSMYTPSARIAKQDNLLTFSMNGIKTPYAETVDISFTFQAEVSDNTLTGLQQLRNMQYSTQKGNLSANISSSSTLYNEISITSASLNFKRSRIIYTDFNNQSKRRGVSLSGTFELTGVTVDAANANANVKVEVSSGRFDILFTGDIGGFNNSIIQY
ncbi:MAG: hypothetical protein LBF67_03930 [Prevotellaceae bacterium]|nr:hypothetical protein [Prevotellaceae bacterium]